MKKNIAIFCIIVLASCSKNHIAKDSRNDMTDIKIISENKQFKEVGNSLLASYDYPKRWFNQIYNEGRVMSKNDSITENEFEKLDFFDNIKGKKKLENNGRKEYWEVEKNIKIDSIIEFDSAKIGNNKLVYIKSYKTFLDNKYDFPPTEQSVDILFYHNNNFQKKINVYNEINYPYSINLKLGYLNKSGILTTKKFKIDEEGTSYINSKSEDLSKILKP